MLESEITEEYKQWRWQNFERAILGPEDMATTTAAVRTPSFSRRTSGPRSPDIASPIHADRPIRPLPKSRLKSKLSPEQASSIAYPPDPPPGLPAELQFAQQPPPESDTREAVSARENTPFNHNGVVGGRSERREHASHCTCGHDDGPDSEVEFDHPDYRYATTPTPTNHSSTTAINGAANKPPIDPIQRRLLEASRHKPPPPPGSTASSADGYESFENTSNKKKRKIPLSSATSAIHQSQLSAEMASMGISQTDGALDDGSGPVAVQRDAYPNAPLGTGISGSGRGRIGRQSARNGERRSSGVVGSMNGYGARAAAPRPNAAAAAGTGVGESVKIGDTENAGIISKAIQSAAEQGPLASQQQTSTPAKDIVNNSASPSSLLSSAAAPTSTTPKTQFTFSAPSESASKMADQQAAAFASSPAYGNGYPPPGAYPSSTPPAAGVTPRANGHNKGTATQGTQTTPSLRSTTNQPNNATRGPPPPPNSINAGAPPAPKPPKPRRRPSKEYALAARQRQLQQEYTNYHHRPSKENMWICEFCEYEDIFGVPPLAMIRRYEIKDRMERKKAAEKRRLLEKAKMKGRKGKKGKGKNNNGNNGSNNVAPAVNGNGTYPNDLPQQQPGGPGVGGEGEEYYDEEDEEYEGEEYDPVEGDLEGDAAYYPPGGGVSGGGGGGGLHSGGEPVPVGGAGGGAGGGLKA